MGSTAKEIESGSGMTKTTLFRLLTAIFLLTTFAVSVFAQTDEQLRVLSGVIQSGSIEEKRDALLELGRFRSEPASQIAANALNDPTISVRAAAIGAVVYLPRIEASRILVPLLSDRSDFIRQETVYALGEVGDPSVADELVSVLQKDKNEEVKSAASVALGKIGNPLGTDALVGVFRKKPKSSNSFLRRSAARSIGQIAEVYSQFPVSEATPESFLPDKYKTMAAEGLEIEEVGGSFSEAAIVLKRVLNNSKETNDTRREAAFALGAIGNDTSKPSLTTCAASSDYYLAEICKEALLRFTNR